MDNKEKLAGYNEKAGGQTEVSIGDHSEYLRRINDGRVKSFAFLLTASEQQLAPEVRREFLNRKYLRLIVTARDKARIREKKQRRNGITSEIDQAVDQNIRSKEIVLERIPGSSYPSVDSFLEENADKLHEYVGYKKGVLSVSENRVIIADLFKQQGEGNTLLEQPTAAPPGGSGTHYPLITTYRVDNYRGEEDSLASSLQNATPYSWAKILIVLTIVLLTFLFYYLRLWQKLLSRVRAFFAS